MISKESGFEAEWEKSAESGEDVDLEHALKRLLVYLPETGRYDLPPNHFLKVITKSHAVNAWYGVDNALAAFSFHGILPNSAKGHESNFALSVAITRNGQPGDIFHRKIDDSNFPRVHGEFVLGQSLPFRMRYGLFEDNGISINQGPYEESVWTNYFSLNPHRDWGDPLDKGLVMRDDIYGLYEAYDEWPFYKDAVATANEVYSASGITLSRATGLDGISVGKARSLSSGTIWSRRRPTQMPEIYFPRRIAYDTSLLHINSNSAGAS
ncbi:MAG: hypothetical protein U0525_03050 [Patescibacteria group bacterium]